MTADPDPVDSALKLLQAQSWAGETYNPLFEEKLMNELSGQHTIYRITACPGLLLAVAGVLASGFAFAATGGVEMLRSPWMTIDIAGKPVSVEIQPTGENTYAGSLNRRLADLPAAQFAGQPEAEVDDSGTLTLTWDRSDEFHKDKQVIKLHTRED